MFANSAAAIRDLSFSAASSSRRGEGTFQDWTVETLALQPAQLLQCTHAHVFVGVGQQSRQQDQEACARVGIERWLGREQLTEHRRGDEALRGIRILDHAPHFHFDLIDGPRSQLPGATLCERVQKAPRHGVGAREVHQPANTCVPNVGLARHHQEHSHQGDRGRRSSSDALNEHPPHTRVLVRLPWRLSGRCHRREPTTHPARVMSERIPAARRTQRARW
jgi:hypothetical protein